MDSDIINRFPPNTKCMADKGFKLKGIFLEHGVNLVQPEFIVKNQPLTPGQVVIQKQVANARIHVERVIGRVRHFRYLTGTIPFAQRDLITPSVIACCALTNVKNGIV